MIPYGRRFIETPNNLRLDSTIILLLDIATIDLSLKIISLPNIEASKMDSNLHFWKTTMYLVHDKQAKCKSMQSWCIG